MGRKGKKMNTLMDAYKQWSSRPADERFQDLLSLKSSVDGRRAISRTKVVELGDLKAHAISDNDLRITSSQPGLGDMVPSNWAFSQTSLRAGAPSGYLRKLPAPLAADCLNHNMGELARTTDGKDLKVLVRDHDEHAQLDAMTGHKYGRIWDSEVVQLAIDIKDWSAGTGKEFYNPKDWNGNPSGLYAGDRDCFIFMIDGGSMLDAGPRAQLNRGFFMWNSEVGSKTFGLKTFFFNVVCGNHMVWDPTGVQELKIRHTLNGHYRFMDEARPFLQEVAMESLAPMESAVKAAITYELDDPNDLDATSKWLQRRGFTKAEARNGFDYALKEEGQCETLWDLTQGITAYARDMATLDARTDLETRAGKLMNIVSGN